jgi:hypothetical protein
MCSKQLIFAVLTFIAIPTLFRAAAQPALAGPPMPYEDIGACPFELCSYRDWQAKNTVVVRGTRSPDGPVLFTVRKGETITALTGVVVTISPGQVRFRTPADLSSGSGPVHVERGDTLYLLTARGEGFTKAWFKGKVYDELDGKAFFNSRCDTEPTLCIGTIIERPKRIWWVSIRNMMGQIGWTNEPEQFTGKTGPGD